MEVIKTFQYISPGQSSPLGELRFKTDCTEESSIYASEDKIIKTQPYYPNKEKKLIFPTRFIKFFKLLSSSEVGQRFWFEGVGCSRSSFEYAGIDTGYDAEVGNIYVGDSIKSFMRYIYRDMVLPFTKLEKENQQLRNKLERKYQQLKQLQEQLERKDQEIKEKDETQIEQLTNLRKIYQELEKTKAELEEKVQQYRQELLTTSTLKFALEAKEEELEQLREKLEIKYHDYLLEVQEEFEEKDQEIEDLKEKLEEKDQDFEAMQEELELKYEDYLQLIQEELEEKDQELKHAQEELKRHGCLLKTCIEELKTHIEEFEEVEQKNQVLEHLNHRLICETSSFVEKQSYFSPEM